MNWQWLALGCPCLARAFGLFCARKSRRQKVGKKPAKTLVPVTSCVPSAFGALSSFLCARGHFWRAFWTRLDLLPRLSQSPLYQSSLHAMSTESELNSFVCKTYATDHGSKSMAAAVTAQCKSAQVSYVAYRELASWKISEEERQALIAYRRHALHSSSSAAHSDIATSSSAGVDATASLYLPFDETTTSDFSRSTSTLAPLSDLSYLD